VKIAIIGGGISGLVAAYFLSRRHRITLFEAGSYLGGHTNTVDASVGGKTCAVDTGFIVYNEHTYPLFTRLLAELGVATQPTTMSFSVRCDATGLEYRGAALNGLFAQRRNLFNWKFYRLLRDILRFNRQADHFLANTPEDQTIADFFQHNRFSREFIDQYFLPMGSAVWSCPRETFNQFPVRFIIEFYKNHGLLGAGFGVPWRTIQGGARNYVAKLSQPFRQQVRLRTAVGAVERHGDAVTVQLADGTAEKFEHLVFACHSDQALRILGKHATATERELLSAFPYQENNAVLHTDSRVLPRKRRAWAAWNYHLAADAAENATVTYNSTMLQSLPVDLPVCVTLNRDQHIDPVSIQGRWIYHHPVFTRHRSMFQRRHAELIDHQRISYCGAYWGAGFHEDGVRSAVTLCEKLLQQDPWKVVSTPDAYDTDDLHRSRTSSPIVCS